MSSSSILGPLCVLANPVNYLTHQKSCNFAVKISCLWIFKVPPALKNIFCLLFHHLTPSQFLSAHLKSELNTWTYKQDFVTSDLEASRGPKRHLHECDIETWGLQWSYTECRLQWCKRPLADQLLKYRILYIFIVSGFFNEFSWGDVTLRIFNSIIWLFKITDG